MQRKPIILILTAFDEICKASENVARAVKKIGTHNVVTLGEDRYGVGKQGKELLPTAKNAKKRAVRISNAVKRYLPEFILVTSPRAYAYVSDAKRKENIPVDVIYIMPYFELDRQLYEHDGWAYIVENGDVKTALVAQGIPSKHVLIMGLPYDIARKTPLEVAAAKQELGIPRTTTVFLNAEPKDGVQELFSLILDQGDVINSVVYCSDSKTVPVLRSKADSVKTNNAVILQKNDQFDQFLEASDVVVTRYDIATIYKAFKLGKPVIAFGRGDADRQLDYLVEKGLVMRARDNIEIVGQLYRLMQTGAAANYIDTAEMWVEMASLDNMANYLVSYIRN